MKHGHTSGPARGRKFTSEYTTWGQMIQRCHNPKSAEYARYGAKGIIVCERWRNSFSDFFADMGPKPSLSHSIDRFPLKGGNYEPGNCRWATRKQQARNTKRNVMLTIDGETLTLPDWAERYGLSPALVSYRLKRLKWTAEQAVKTPVQRGQKRTRRPRRVLLPQEVRVIRSLNGVVPRIEIAERFGVSPAVIDGVLQRKTYKQVR